VVTGVAPQVRRITGKASVFAGTHRLRDAQVRPALPTSDDQYPAAGHLSLRQARQALFLGRTVNVQQLLDFS
jgi:hypothetical protein